MPKYELELSYFYIATDDFVTGFSFHFKKLDDRVVTSASCFSGLSLPVDNLLLTCSRCLYSSPTSPADNLVSYSLFDNLPTPSVLRISPDSFLFPLFCFFFYLHTVHESPTLNTVTMLSNADYSTKVIKCYSFIFSTAQQKNNYIEVSVWLYKLTSFIFRTFSSIVSSLLGEKDNSPHVFRSCYKCHQSTEVFEIFHRYAKKFKLFFLFLISLITCLVLIILFYVLAWMLNDRLCFVFDNHAYAMR